MQAFDELDEATAQQLLLGCAAVPRWAAALVAARPYADPAALVARAEELAAGWTGAEVVQALADHPRIGERHPGTGDAARHSAGEQAGIAAGDSDVAARLAAGNRAYEERFDRIFLVRAAGRSAEEVLDLLEQRLTHDPLTELAVTAGQLREIAVRRVRGLVS
ncbi:OHCU decarboxylase [Marmoricola sp. Leaf446]|nr:OHCU decarboxylase [Marmoricola sp. Leaf446]